MNKRILIFVIAVIATTCVMAQHRAQNPMRQTDAAFFKTKEALQVGEQILLYQRVTGGWPKNINMAKPLTDAEKAQVLEDKQRRNDSTTDNNATSMQMAYLARLYEATKDPRFRDAFQQAVEYLLSGQYENGGWPQFWPEMRDYQIHITFNDDAMVNTMNLLNLIAQSEAPYSAELTTPELRQRAIKAFNKGVECILKTQIRKNGKLTVWCQQHDRDTYEPAPARAYELPSYCSQESVNIVKLLMSLPKPDKRVKAAIHAAMQWFDKYKLTGLRVERTGQWNSPDRNTQLVSDPNADPLWARYYDLEHCEPYVCDRDGIPRRRLEDIGPERRNGYSWYNSHAASLYPLYEQWANQCDPKHKVKISLETKGANENGTIQLFSQPKPDIKAFDAVVKPGQSIQVAIEKAPAHPNSPYKILIKKGTYNEKVIIDRPNIVLVGEQRDSTIIVLAELSKKQTIKEYKGQPVGNGVIVLQENANDCVISGLTIYNNYGTAVEPGNTAHQMSIFGRATRTIIINCNVWADGNDALSLWAKEGNGMYYHSDLYLRCWGVDFLCPRGWCYATRCRFEGDGHALIWHDGRGDRSKKLVITNSTFDAKTPTQLGRYHHDSQFFIINCKMTKNIMNNNIGYAYSDKVLDPCPWGQRVYYYGCTREGGDSGWLQDNLEESEEKPEFHAITALWTFNGKWNPEQRIRDLWNVLAY